MLRGWGFQKTELSRLLEKWNAGCERRKIEKDPEGFGRMEKDCKWRRFKGRVGNLLENLLDTVTL